MTEGTGNVDDQVRIQILTEMARIRIFEQTMERVYLEGKTPVFDIAAGPVPGEMHLAAGQEPVAVGVCMHLRKTDAVTGPHRSHHFALAKGVDMKRMAAEIFGKEAGLCHGKGGHMHLFDTETSFGCSGIIAEGIPTAVGHALAFKRQGRDDIAVAFFGEGAANQGAFHESLNLAALWGLGVIFVSEDNDWGMSVPKAKSTAVRWNTERAVAYGIPGVLVEDNDALALYQAAGEAVRRARAGEGPTLIEVRTDRLLGHFEGDQQLYRAQEEFGVMEQRDAVVALERQLVDSGTLTAAQAEEIWARATAEVDEAIEFARAAEYPAADRALANVFA